MRTIFQTVTAIALTITALAGVALAQTPYEKCIAEARTSAEQTRCAIFND